MMRVYVVEEDDSDNEGGSVTYLALMNICAYLPRPSGLIGTIT